MATSSPSPVRRALKLIWGDWQTNELWQRLFKSSLACTVALIIAVIPQVVAVFGLNTYLVPMTTVFAHPGQRMAKMIESLILILVGAFVGLAWSILGLYLSTLVVDQNVAAASSIRALFMLVSTLAHGFIRSTTPRLFVAVWLLLVASATTLMGRATEVSLAVFTSIIYPILAGTGVVLVVNLVIFPELSTSYLGSSTISTLSETMDTVSQATYWFVTPGGDSEAAKKKRKRDEAAKRDQGKKTTWWESFKEDFPNPFVISSQQKSAPPDLSLITLVDLADKKSALRESLQRCKAAQDEVNFEYSISPLPPKSLKPISKHGMSSLVQNVVTLIGACENKFVLLSSDAVEEAPMLERSIPIVPPKEGIFAPAVPKFLQKVQEEDHENDGLQSRIDEVKPLREIESGSVDLLESILNSLREPVQEFELAFKEASTLAMSCIAYCFDVPRLPSGVLRPHGIEVEEVDLRIESFISALARFDRCSAEELKIAAMNEGKEIDLMPRMEMFLVSSFLLGFRQAALHVLSMLRHARELVDQRRKRHDRPTIWLPHYADFRQWLNTAGESDAMVLPEKARKEIRTGKTSKPASSADSADSSTSEDPLPWQKNDEERGLNRQQKVKREMRSPAKKEKRTLAELTWVMKLRGTSADALEWAQHSDDLTYALKLAVAVFCVSWPSFVSSWREWYGEVRGIWAPLQLVLVFEVSIGTSLFIFFLRLLGVMFGCVVGYASYEIGRGNRIAMVVILVFGIVPSVYIQVATKYVKAGMISITTMCVVALAAMNQSGTAYENFYKRLVAFLIGSLVAIIVEVFIFPVRARHRLVESLSASVRQVQNMHSAISVGIDGPEKPNFRSHKLHSRFQRARDKAQASLAAAETFLPFCLNEPRLKGSFKPLEPIYKEIIYVLHQIIDRMDNVIDLRKAYGSSVLEDLNAHVYAYRRNVAAANTLILFSVHEALTTWLPLPQFIPSTRLAQLRLINRVREVLENKMTRECKDGIVSVDGVDMTDAASFITQRKFLAWNANAAGHVEIIEYLEELVELTKLLVGVNAFRSGLLERPQYKDYVEQMQAEREVGEVLGASKSAPVRPSEEEPTKAPGGDVGASLRKVATMAASVQKFRQSLRANREQQAAVPPTQSLTLTVQESHVDEGALPQSLRRVGTRLQREGTVVRRRGYSTTSRVTSRD